jgi:hypothetical protein
VKRIMLIFATVATMAMMMVAATVPALADHRNDTEYVWTEFIQWRDTNWYCSYLWEWHGSWDYWGMWCYNDRTGEVYSDL